MSQKATSVAVIAGNGLSISCNKELALPKLTKAVRERLSSETGNLAEGFRSLAAALNLGSNQADDDFEALIGIFDDLTHYLEELKSLSIKMSSIESANKTKNSAGSNKFNLPTPQEFEHIQKYIGQLRQAGILHVLEVTHNLSQDSNDEHIVALLKSLTGKFKTVNIANLNYDTILLRKAIRGHRNILCDMGKGEHYGANTYLPNTDGSPSRQLRFQAKDYYRSIDYNRASLRLLHLHGSLTFWELKDQPTDSYNKFAKINASSLTASWWERSRNIDCNHTPVVVLANTNNKKRYVTEPPFAEAYNQFKYLLNNSDNWVIIGYSFRDSAINAMIKEAALKKLKKQNKSFKIFVSEIDLTIDIPAIEEKIGVEKGLLQNLITFHRSGAEHISNSREWEEFTR